MNEQKKQPIIIYDGEITRVVTDAETWNNLKKYGEYEADYFSGEIYRAENNRLYYLNIYAIPEKQRKYCNL